MSQILFSKLWDVLLAYTKVYWASIMSNLRGSCCGGNIWTLFFGLILMFFFFAHSIEVYLVLLIKALFSLLSHLLLPNLSILGYIWYIFYCCCTKECSSGCVSFAFTGNIPYLKASRTLFFLWESNTVFLKKISSIGCSTSFHISGFVANIPCPISEFYTQSYINFSIILLVASIYWNYA